MDHIRVGSADVMLQDFGKGKGKIVISDDRNNYTFSHIWNAMGENGLAEFLTKIDEDYFVGKFL